MDNWFKRIGRKSKVCRPDPDKSEDILLKYAENIINTVREPLIALDRDFRVLSASRSFYEVFKVNPEETVGQLIYSLGNKQWNIPRLRALLETILPKKTTFDNYEVKHNFPYIGMRIMRLNARQIQSVSGKEGIILLAIEDITARKKDSEALNRAQSDFLTGMSHEIRTPISSIIGMVEMLLDTRLDEKQKRQLHSIKRSADALLYITGDILDIAKMEAGALKIRKEPYDPREVAESVVEMFAHRTFKELELVLNVSADIPVSVLGDGNRLRQVLINLVGNAFKFTLKGRIRINAELLKGKAAGWLVFSVADTGVGISEENQKKLFRKFSQVGDSSAQRHGGTGLGLSISKALVEMMGGDISLESEEGKGSIFSFRLPCEEASADQVRREENVSFSGMRALLVDDNTVSLEILVQNMAIWGFSTVSARNAAEALELLKSAGKFNLLVVDHQMLCGDGEQFIAEAVGSAAAEGAKIIILHSRGETIPASVKPAVSVSLAKPIIRSRLFDALLKVFRPDALHAASAGASVPKRGYSHLRILLVEDNADTRNLTRIMLEKAGYKLDIAADCREALEKCAALNYDLVLMDIQMPETDVHKAVLQLRKTEACKTTPIIALTAYNRESDITKSLSLGMNAHITRPLKEKALYGALDKWLDTRYKVLIVDDDPDSLKLVELHLKGEAGLRFYWAPNGQEALKMLERNVFSLVMMDMEMPVMDGLTAVRELRKTAAGKTVPVVAFSAHDDPVKIKECLEAGYTDYLLKPVKKAGLLEKIHKYL
ncbi:MAG: response regulator [Elusimicrobia bacterium]|nr:response regulator [Elusimicrobiota bacterium]